MSFKEQRAHDWGTPGNTAHEGGWGGEIPSLSDETEPQAVPATTGSQSEGVCDCQSQTSVLERPLEVGGT